MTHADSRLDDLIVRYHASLKDKHARIGQAWQALRTECRDPRSRTDLLLIIHRLAGSAESYGYTAIGQVAAQADALLDRIRGLDSDEQRSISMCALLDELAPLVDALQGSLEEASSGTADSSRDAS